MDRLRATLEDLRAELGPWWLPKTIGYLVIGGLALLSLYFDIIVLFSFGD